MLALAVAAPSALRLIRSYRFRRLGASDILAIVFTNRPGSVRLVQSTTRLYGRSSRWANDESFSRGRWERPGCSQAGTDHAIRGRAELVVTIGEAATRLGVSRAPLEAMIDAGTIKALATGNARKRRTVVAQSERLDERINRAMAELVELGAVRPRLLADDTIELRPAPASPDLSQKVTEIFERAGARELRPWVWGVEEVSRPSSQAVRVRSIAALALLGALVGALIGILRFRQIGYARSRLARRRQLQ